MSEEYSFFHFDTNDLSKDLFALCSNFILMLHRTLNQFHCINFCLSDCCPIYVGMRQRVKSKLNKFNLCVKTFAENKHQDRTAILPSSGSVDSAPLNSEVWPGTS